MTESVIPLSMPVHNRPHYVARTLRSLACSSLPPGAVLVAHDDASDDPRVAGLLAGVSALPVEHRRSAANRGHNRNSVYGLEACFRDHPAAAFAVNIDSDTVFNPHWLEVLADCHRRHADRPVAALSAFNVEHGWHRTLDRLDDGTCVKSSLGGFGLLIPRAFWEACGTELYALVESQPQVGWDWLLSDLARRRGWQLLALPQSRVQHIGVAEGMHAGGAARADVAVNFAGIGPEEDRNAPVHWDGRWREGGAAVPGHERCAAVLGDWLAPGPATVLDAGGGDGALAGCMRDDLTPTVLDWSDVALSRARAAGHGAAQVQADLNQPLPFGDGAFDIVVCRHVLQYLRAPRVALSELLRVAARGLWLEVPQGGEFEGPVNQVFDSEGLAALLASLRSQASFDLESCPASVSGALSVLLLKDHRQARPAGTDEVADPQALQRLAVARYRDGMPEEALAALRRAVTAAPHAARLRLALAALLHEQGRYAEAVAEYRAVLQRDAALEEARRGLCEALRDQGAQALEEGQPEVAAASYRELLDRAPGDSEARNNLGVALQRQGRMEEARVQFEAVLEVDPAHVDAHINLGAEMQRCGDYRLAVAHYQAALDHDPGNAAACLNLAILRRHTGHVDQAVEYGRHAVRRGAAEEAGQGVAGLELRRLLHLPAVYQSAGEIESTRERLRAGLAGFARRDVRFSDPLTAVGVTNFFLAYHGYGDADIQRQLGALYRRAYTPSPLSLDRPADGRIRLGLVSSYFNNHTIGKLNLGTVRGLDRDRFSVHVFSIGDHRDRTARAFRQAADNYTVLPRRLDGIRTAIAAAGLDMLLFTDIGMDAVTYFLAFSRLAPVQCATWGHPITTGIDTVDYFISARDAETDDSDAHYTERLVRLPTMQPFYYRPEIAGARKPRVALGLPEDRTLYVCPQTLFKFHPDFDPMLGGILRGDPRGVLVLIEAQDGAWTELLKARFRSTLPDVADRILFLPRMSGSDFLSLVANADVMLDTPVFCGGNTTYEGLAMGTPIVTLPSGLTRGRLSYAIYRKMGMTDCVANDPEDYVRIALGLGTDRDFRQGVSETIRERCPALYEDPHPLRELEDFIEQAVVGRGEIEGLHRRIS